jgi:hypothetical protein
VDRATQDLLTTAPYLDDMTQDDYAPAVEAFAAHLPVLIGARPLTRSNSASGPKTVTARRDGDAPLDTRPGIGAIT